MIAPGSRREVLVRGGRPGAYPLKAIPFSQFPGGDKAVNGGPVPNETLLTLRSAGEPNRTPFPAHATLSHPIDLRTKHVDRKRTIVFSEMTEPSGATAFLLNGMKFDPEPHRRDDEARLGRAVDARQRNERMAHVPHPHQRLPGRQRRGQARAVRRLDEDNVALPPKSRRSC